MSDDTVITDKFRKKLAAKRAERDGAQNDAQPSLNTTVTEQPVQLVPDADIPDVTNDLNLSIEEQTIDAAIAAIGIIDAYNRWSNKGTVPPTNKTEGIKVSCPNPAHRDDHASAWLNTEKNLWNCGGCNMGGDRWDIAAWFYGYDVPGYKDKDAFRELRTKIAAELGFREIKGISGTFLVRDVPDDSGQAGISGVSPNPDNTVSQSDSATGTVGALPSAIAAETQQEEIEAARNGPSLDWRDILSVTGGDTFLDAWMRATTVDTCPEEYHFWTGLMALGFSVGRNRVLYDDPFVVGNLFVCLVGPSGTGKSRSKRHLSNVLREALPFDSSLPFPQGTKIIAQPGSGEAFVDTFSHPIIDPSTNKPTGKYAPIRGYVDFDEMAALMARANRQGSSLKTQLMEAADAPLAMSNISRMSGMSEAYKPFAQVITTTQNRSLSGLISNTDEGAGFVNRWVFATGVAKPRTLLPNFLVDLSESTKRLKDVWAWSLNNEKVIPYEQDAQVAMYEFFKDSVWPAIDKMDAVDSAILGRLEVLLKKLVLLFTVNEKRETVPLHVVEMVKKIYPYLLKTYGVIYRAIGNSESQDYQERIIGAIHRWYDRNKTFPSANNISKSLPPRYRELKLIHDNINLMVKMGILVEIAPEAAGRGRPTVRYGIAI